MDYLEGFLIGPVWSDTDYKSHRHFNAHLLLAFVMAAAFAACAFLPSLAGGLVVVRWPASVFLLAAIVLVTPFISSFYYRFPLYLRPLILILYAARFVLLFYLLLHVFLPFADFDRSAIPAALLTRMDAHINHMMDLFAESGGIFRTVLGVVVGTMWIIGEGLLLVVILIAIPLMAIGLLKGIQYLLDRLVQFLLYRPLHEGVAVRVPEKKPDPELKPRTDAGDTALSDR